MTRRTASGQPFGSRAGARSGRGVAFEPLQRALRRAFGRPTNRRGDEAGLSECSMEDEIARAARARKGCPFLSTEQAAFYLGLSPRKLQAMRAAGTGPRFRRHSRYVRYHIDDLDVWSTGLSAGGTGSA